MSDFLSGVDGVNGTPCFFINGYRYDGFRDAARLTPLLQEMIRVPRRRGATQKVSPLPRAACYHISMIDLEMPVAADGWPRLPLEAWADTYATLHRWSQIVGKIALALTPLTNHWWNIALRLNARGLTTGPMPCQGRNLQIDFDFITHELRLLVSDGASKSLPLSSRSVARFYRELMAALAALNIHVRIWPVPVEIADPIPFEKDEQHATYDPDSAHRHWRILARTARVMQRFRARFLGKSSPVNFFWGSFDLAQTRFSGRAAPPHPGMPTVADYVTREAYSHECSSCGFWPGGGALPMPLFYAYAYAEPPGFRDAAIRPGAAFYNKDFGEFVLPYDAVRSAADPDARLLEFFQTAYEAAADLGRWDRRMLERQDNDTPRQ